MPDNDPEIINEYDKNEWRDVARILRPDWTDEQFEEAWLEFCELKRSKAQH